MKNKMKLVNILLILFLVGFVKADTDVNVGVISNDNINFNANLNAGGNIDLTIDGINYKDSLTNLENQIHSSSVETVTTLQKDISDSSMEMDSIYYRLSELFMKFDSLKRMWEIINPNDLDTSQERTLRAVFDEYFVPRSEVNKMMNYYDQRITDLELRVLSLEKVIGEEDVLKGRLNVANEIGVDLTYNNVTYYYTGHSFVSLKTVEGSVEEKEDKSEDEGPDQHKQLVIEEWKRLCDKGVEKFCLVLEQRGLID